MRRQADMGGRGEGGGTCEETDGHFWRGDM